MPRGRRITAVSLATGATLAAWRGRKGIEIRSFDAPTGGAPELVAAKAEVGEFEAAPVHVAALVRTPSVVWGHPAAQRSLGWRGER